MFFLFMDPFLIAAAVIPAILLIVYVYKKDTLDKEPVGLIVGLAFIGILSTVGASIAETAGSAVLNLLIKDPESVLYRVLLYFVIVGFAEEFSKYFLVRKKTWNAPAFNCSFDAVVYCTSVSLGFALWENIKYVMAYGFQTALLRAVTAIPGHACFGVFMGVFYGLAKRKENMGNAKASAQYRKAAVVLPSLIHGLYDYLASAPGMSTLPFIITIGILFLFTYKLVNAAAKEDSFL